MNLVDLLYSAVLRAPDNPCVMHKVNGSYQMWTYKEVWSRIEAFAIGLVHVGVKPGDRVAIFSNNCPEWMISDFALLMVQAVSVPIYPTLRGEQVTFIASHSDISAAIVQGAQISEELAGAWPDSLRRLIVIDDTLPVHLPPQAKQVTRFIDLEQKGLNLHKPLDWRGIPEDDLATIVHTSGTSGHPKGVMLSHRNIVSNVQSALTLLSVTEKDLALSYLPLSHVFERTVGQFAALSCGAAIAYAQSIETIPQNLLEIRPTLLITVPRLLEKVYSRVQSQVDHAPPLIRKALLKGMNDASSTGLTYRLVDRLVYRKLRQGLGNRMRLVVSGGAALSAEIARFYQRAGIPIYEGYGMTEAAPVIAANPLHDSRPGSVGVALPGVQVKLGPGGELWVRGSNVMMGYYGDPQATSTALADGWLHTGDIAEIDTDQYIHIVDRIKNILVLATGKNVAPGPIENAIMLSPLFSSAVVLGDGQKYVTCLLAPNPDGMRPLAQSLGLSEDVATWTRHPQIRYQVGQEIARLTATFAEYEQPKRAALLPSELTIETGELTPTLKVRSRAIAQRYGAVIAAMYEGQDFIPIIPSATDEKSSYPPGSGEWTLAEEERPAPQDTGESRRTHARRPGRWVLGLGLAILVLGGGTALAASITPPGALNILGMVQGLRHNNQQIAETNHKITGALQAMGQTAAKTGTMEGQLQTLQQGARADTGTLQQLDGLSQQEQNLSTQFASLATQLQTNLGQVAQASAEQSQQVQQLHQLAIHVSRTAFSLAACNAGMAGKLSTAQTKTDALAQEVP